MPKMLNDGAVEYEDGTPATEAQVGLLCIYCFSGKGTWLQDSNIRVSSYEAYSLQCCFWCRWEKML